MSLTSTAIPYTLWPMDLETAAPTIETLLARSRTLFLRTIPEVPDFTNNALDIKVLISDRQGSVDLTLNKNTARNVASLLELTLFNRECVDVLFCWNVKSLLSFLRFMNGKVPEPQSSIVDLQTIENFLGIKQKAPETFVEVINRSKAISASKSWKPLYLALHLPLMLRVLPAMETTGLLDITERTPKYAYYEVEGQINGRLKCAKWFKQGFIPHTMGADVKSNLNPLGLGNWFLTADMRHCEVTVLQWLTGDDRFKQILDSGKDLHREIYEIITGDPCDTDKKRDMSKVTFLPVAYGCSGKKLAENIGVSEQVGYELVSRINASFPVAMGWLAEQQRLAAEGGIVTDFFNRPRTYPEAPYLVRNFLVQSVAATVCLEKLVDLYETLKEMPIKICFSVHDGYGFIVPTADKKLIVQVYKIIRSVLEAESKLCPGLKLKASFQLGPKLNELRSVGG